jgi:hypothetical protein
MKSRLSAALCAAAAMSIATSAAAADHLDAPGAKADPAADLNDLYTFLDGDRVVFAMTVFPLADSGSKFSDKVQYVLNIESGPTFGVSADGTKLICTFDAAQKASCWLGTDEYASGDASAEVGLSSASGDLKVFAGLREDPFFFNLEGFNDAVSVVQSAGAQLTFDTAGCPAIDASTSSALVGLLQGTSMGTQPAKDFFATARTLAIVASVKKPLVTKGGAFVSVWASTHKAP